MGAKSPNIFQFMGKVILKGPSIPHFAFKEQSHSYLNAIRRWSYACFRVFRALQ